MLPSGSFVDGGRSERVGQPRARSPHLAGPGDPIRRIFQTLVAVGLLVTGARVAVARCGDGAGDAEALAGARAQVDLECGCASAASHALYLACATKVARERVAASALPKRCRRSVRRCAARSTCGRRSAVTCCLTRKGRTRCKVRKKAARCVAKGGCVGVFPSCCDACTATGCRALPTTTTTTTTTDTTSTSTSTTTTSSTTTTTFAEGQPCQESATEALPCGATVACQLDPAGDTDGFTFVVPDGAAVSISVSGSFKPCWQLFGPNGAVNQPQCDTVNDAGSLLAGTYTINVTELTSQMTDYVLSLQGVSESFHCGTMLTLPSDTRSASLTPAGDTDSYDFAAQAGQIFALDIAGDHNPCWRLFGPDGVPVLSERCRTDGVTATPPLAAGTHTIVVRELVDQTSDYTLSVQLVTP